MAATNGSHSCGTFFGRLHRRGGPVAFRRGGFRRGGFRCAGLRRGGAGGGGGGASGQATVLSRVGLAARLSKIEYQNSVADVLGVALLPAELDAAAGGIPDDTGDGVLKHLADKQTSVEQHALAYFQVADGVAKRADMAALSTRLGTCTKDTADCGAAFVRAVGRRLFRRPLDQRETDAMLVVYNAALGEKLAFAEAARWALRALLQAPQFLFRMDKETSGVGESAPRPRRVRAGGAALVVPVGQRSRRRAAHRRRGRQPGQAARSWTRR